MASARMEYGFVVLRCCFSEFSTCSLAGSCCCFALLCVRCAVPALLGCFALTGVLCDTCAGKCYGQRDSTGFGAREKRFKALRSGAYLSQHHEEAPFVARRSTIILKRLSRNRCHNIAQTMENSLSTSLEQRDMKDNTWSNKCTRDKSCSRAVAGLPTSNMVSV
jgi:hypothetical protein